MFNHSSTYGVYGKYYLYIDSYGDNQYHPRARDIGYHETLTTDQEFQDNYKNEKLYKELVRSYGLAKMQRNKTEMSRLEKRLRIYRYANLQ
jgi:hypothetical protein